MARIPEYTASGEFHAIDRGLNAYDTMGRRVAGQYDAASTDLAQAGRVTAQASEMIGRWPFNILKLMRSQSQAQDRAGSGGVNIRTARSGRSITDAQFAPRYMPDLAALNQMSEGMGQVGRYSKTISTPPGGYGSSGGSSRSGSSNSPYLSGYQESQRGFGTTSDRDGYSALELKQRDREAQLYDMAEQKSWDNYEKNLSKYNADVLSNAQQASPYGVYPTSTDDNSSYTSLDTDYGSPAPEAPTTSTEYGGGDTSWFSGFSSTDAPPATY